MTIDPRHEVPMSNPPVPGSLEEISHTLSELQRQFEMMIFAMRATTEELQRMRKANDELVDHCATLAECLWSERGRSQELERQVEWFRSLVGTRPERQSRPTPTEGLPPDEEVTP